MTIDTAGRLSKLLESMDILGVAQQNEADGVVHLEDEAKTVRMEGHLVFTRGLPVMAKGRFPDPTAYRGFTE